MPRNKTKFDSCHTGQEPLPLGLKAKPPNVIWLSVAAHPVFASSRELSPYPKSYRNTVLSESHTRNIHFQVLIQ
jgi:hypothetical protein